MSYLRVTSLDLWVIVFYFFVIIANGIYQSVRKTKGGDDFLLGGKSFGIFSTLCTQGATMKGSSALVGIQRGSVRQRRVRADLQPVLQSGSLDRGHVRHCEKDQKVLQYHRNSQRRRYFLKTVRVGNAKKTGGTRRHLDVPVNLEQQYGGYWPPHTSHVREVWTDI